ncbi:hypothetical protein RHSIM_Rhsim09G0091100 [Rhododendron simsii]|uniref:Uncharacterized protein n=1 Tax=Rhododendron simsii TaxID=118357 RepID=A0A834GH42_RHOSS|nr:hypothetical protein RHSIM_Rhsim09G0091100 [Rhododendron simsii]
MLSRFRPSSPHLRLLTLISSSNGFSTLNPQFTNPIPNSNFLLSTPRSLSTNRNNSNNGNDHPTPKINLWNISTENEEEESVFGEDAGGTLEGIFSGDGKPAVATEEESWLGSPAAADGGGTEDDIFKGVEKEVEGGHVVIEGSMLPNRAFGGLVAASGITEEMLDSLMALKDMDGIKGLPPLTEIEDMLNEKEFDVYFPMLDHRAALLRPFSETKTLGLWNIDCTVKGGDVSEPHTMMVFSPYLFVLLAWGV